MRISDWSSDVCSSDLVRKLDEPAEQFLRNIDDARANQGLEPIGDGPGTPSSPSGGANVEVPGLGKVTDDTIDLFNARSGLKEALQENGRAAKFLKLCKSPCYPENVTVEQIKRLESILEAMPPEIKVNSAKISEALKEMDEQQIWAFLDHFEEETLARAKMLSDLGYGGGGVDDVDDLIEETGRRRANVRGTGGSPGQALEIGRGHG